MFVQLPADWPYKQLDDPQHTWPMRWLRSTAQYPAYHDTWLGGRYALVANDDPPQPLAPHLPFTCLLFLAEQSLVARDGRTMQRYRRMPLKKPWGHRGFCLAKTHDVPKASLSFPK